MEITELTIRGSQEDHAALQQNSRAWRLRSSLHEGDSHLISLKSHPKASQLHNMLPVHPGLGFQQACSMQIFHRSC
jgi:hypothetical protein